MFLLFCFFFKQKTAYEMLISDWSSDVCSSDLADPLGERLRRNRPVRVRLGHVDARSQGCERVNDAVGVLVLEDPHDEREFREVEIGRASCRERVCQYV